ncbi:MAG: hypothetical protein PHY05_11330, partial [Methanothrix sp.]|nr:hypothetical protein [Methanothrix sp.]
MLTASLSLALDISTKIYIKIGTLPHIIIRHINARIMIPREIVTNDPYIFHDSDFSEYHLFYPFLISAMSTIISTYCLTKDLLISSSEAIFSAGIPS